MFTYPNSYLSHGNLFVSAWKTDNGGASNDDQIALPLQSTGTYNFTVDWGDGNQDTITVWNQSETTHTYSSAATYTIRIKGVIDGFRFANSGDDLKIVNISKWGSLKLGNNGNYFDGCKQLTITVDTTDTLDVSGMNNFNRGFQNCQKLTTIPGITNWATGSIATWSNMFAFTDVFNQNLNGLDTSGGTAFDDMLSSAFIFNGEIDEFDMSNAANISRMLQNTSWDKDISSWVITSVTSATSFLANSSFSQTNYDLLLPAWEGQAVQDNVGIDFGSAVFGAGAPATARAALIADHTWTITDGGAA